MWDTSIRHLAWYAIEAALDDAHTTSIDAIYVGNMLAGTLSGQEHLGALVADFSGLRGREAVTVEAADASGGAALRQGILAVQSGLVETALVVGVEKMTDQTGTDVLSALATTLDADYEAAHGATPAAMAALLMRRYMYEYGVEVQDFAGFSVNAHANGGKNPLAMFQNRLRPESFGKAPPVSTPISLFDAAPMGDGAAAVILTSKERAMDMVPNPVRVLGSAIATDTLALHDRKDLLWLKAAELSAGKVLGNAGISHQQIDLFELHDAFTILAALSLEACGFAERGKGWQMAQNGAIGLDGSVPISTFGGLKARGHAGGATGVYQAVEIARQLRGEAGDNQISNAKIGMAQNLGGLGATAVTHLFGMD
jgi:acetyl-CoA C-acetyltransferase